MDIYGFERTTLLDFPGRIACTVFVGGCNFRCPYCYNPELVLGFSNRPPRIADEELFSFLRNRRAVLDGVVVCGGEPTLQDDLGLFLGKVRELGLATKLDTNGSRPATLRNVLEEGLLDFVSLDVKAPLDSRYRYAAGVTSSVEAVRESIGILIRSGIDFELRTTVVPGLHTKESLVDLARQLADICPSSSGVKWFLQQFQPRGCLDSSFVKIRPYGPTVLEEILEAVRAHISTAELRGV